MERKNRAAKAINTALGLILILAVILASPIFGYGLGIASADQRTAAADPAPAAAQSTGAYPTSATATPRPTAQPTPTPVILPTAPPAPDPTPLPTPRPVQQPVQQNVPQYVQQTWNQEEYWEGEEEYEEEYVEEYIEVEEDDGAGYGGEELGSEIENGMIETGGADLIFQTGDSDPGVYTPPQQEEQSWQGGSESEGFVFE